VGTLPASGRGTPTGPGGRWGGGRNGGRGMPVRSMQTALLSQNRQLAFLLVSRGWS
jgi:hypothetical protein